MQRECAQASAEARTESNTAAYCSVCCSRKVDSCLWIRVMEGGGLCVQRTHLLRQQAPAQLRQHVVGNSRRTSAGIIDFDERLLSVASNQQALSGGLQDCFNWSAVLGEVA
eukprot:908865-Pelagomonas_calceolata.AAC.10